ncbi:MAG TPA: hypothetical protein VE172_22255 [Stackebrandtia sp.]|uniref:hypothetical protein n=1 Tax=Stackebrandtia sp. TaxID=2023065 RepID=UPI002D323E67|nr:hypothetical protein [Stackebrandtia sp.]HZE41532.1 hypothetical protein [Stackebrandtia sp.]
MKAPEDTRPNYRLWHATCSRGSGGLAVCFDVTAGEFVGLADGDHALMAAFAKSLGLGTVEVRSWRIERFCSPYYGYDHHGEDWRERLDVAWRVTVNVAGDARPFDYSGLGPMFVHGHDSTWLDDTLWWGESRSSRLSNTPGHKERSHKPESILVPWSFPAPRTMSHRSSRNG